MIRSPLVLVRGSSAIVYALFGWLRRLFAELCFVACREHGDIVWVANVQRRTPLCMTLPYGRVQHFAWDLSDLASPRILKPPRTTTAAMITPIVRSGSCDPSSKTSKPETMTPMFAITSFAEKM